MNRSGEEEIDEERGKTLHTHTYTRTRTQNIYE